LFIKIKQFYQFLILAGTAFQPVLLLILRLYWGFSFFKAGLGKWQHIDSVSQYFASLHILLPTANAYIASSIECIGGLLLLFGLASRLVSIPLSIVMITAYLTAHLDSIKTLLVNPANFIAQDPFTYLLVCLLIFAFGPGAFSLDALLKRFVFKIK
jgi:putative oxidoreductase